MQACATRNSGGNAGELYGARNNISQALGICAKNAPSARADIGWNDTGTGAWAKDLDNIDLMILRELQDDGRITNVELARRVGISPPPCLRRVRALEEAGYITRLSRAARRRKLGFDVTVFASVHLSSQADADLRAFENFVRAEPLVRECWMLSGEIDFILNCVAPDMAAFQEFVVAADGGAACPQRQDLAGAAQFQGCAPAVPLELEVARKRADQSMSRHSYLIGLEAGFPTRHAQEKSSGHRRRCVTGHAPAARRGSTDQRQRRPDTGTRSSTGSRHRRR